MGQQLKIKDYEMKGSSNVGSTGLTEFYCERSDPFYWTMDVVEKLPDSLISERIYVTVSGESIDVLTFKVYVSENDFQEFNVKDFFDKYKVLKNDTYENMTVEQIKASLKGYLEIQSHWQHAVVPELIRNKKINTFAAQVYRFNEQAENDPSNAIVRDVADKMTQLLALLRKADPKDDVSLIELDQVIKRASMLMQGFELENISDALATIEIKALDADETHLPSENACEENRCVYRILEDKSVEYVFRLSGGESHTGALDAPKEGASTPDDIQAKLKGIIQEALTNVMTEERQAQNVENLNQMMILANGLKTNPNKIMQRIAGVMIGVGIIVVVASVLLPTAPGFAPHFASLIASVGGFEVSNAMIAGGAALTGVIGAVFGGAGFALGRMHPSLSHVVTDLVIAKDPTRSHHSYAHFFSKTISHKSAKEKDRSQDHKPDGPTTGGK